MTNLGDNLRLLLEHVGITETELSRKTGISQPVINRITSGQTYNPNVGTLSPLAKFFDISIGQLIGEEPLIIDGEHGIAKKSQSTLKKLPLLDWTQVVAWSHDRQSIKKTLYTTTERDASADSYSLKVTDPTLNSIFPENTLLIIEPKLPPKHRDYAVIHEHGKNSLPFIRQVLIEGGETYLKPLNANFKIITMTEALSFLGVVIQARMDLCS